MISRMRLNSAMPLLDNLHKRYVVEGDELARDALIAMQSLLGVIEELIPSCVDAKAVDNARDVLTKLRSPR